VDCGENVTAVLLDCDEKVRIAISEQKYFHFLAEIQRSLRLQ